MPETTYQGKTYFVESNDARVRKAGNLGTFEKWRDGDVLPQGAAVGGFKIIPKRTEVMVSDVAVDERRSTFVLAVSVDPSTGAPSGWTAASNLAGAFSNEVVGYEPPLLEPAPADCFTVTDAKALVRRGGPNYTSTGETLALGSLVRVKETSADTTPKGKYVRVGPVGADGVEGEAVGWTAAANLTEGAYALDAASWGDDKGPNACWERGRFVGSRVLAMIVGTGGELERVTLAGHVAYQKLLKAATTARFPLAIESGFRTYASQAALYDGWIHRRPGFNLAAKPGSSNHQNGVAFDLNTHGFDGDPLYDWLKKNGPKFGFIRTVNREHWHWEYRPDEAPALAAAGKFKRSNVAR